MNNKYEESNLYTNLAFWFSDQYNIDTKVAVYQGLDRAVFRTKKEFAGSIIEQIDEVVKYFDLCNEVKIIIDGDPIRKEFPSYNKIAAREAILNCYCHRLSEHSDNLCYEKKNIMRRWTGKFFFYELFWFFIFS